MLNANRFSIFYFFHSETLILKHQTDTYTIPSHIHIHIHNTYSHKFDADDDAKVKVDALADVQVEADAKVSIKLEILLNFIRVWFVRLNIVKVAIEIQLINT